MNRTVLKSCSIFLCMINPVSLVEISYLSNEQIISSAFGARDFLLEVIGGYLFSILSILPLFSIYLECIKRTTYKNLELARPLRGSFA